MPSWAAQKASDASRHESPASRNATIPQNAC
jgi:hypothetical protein